MDKKMYRVYRKSLEYKDTYGLLACFVVLNDAKAWALEKVLLSSNNGLKHSYKIMKSNRNIEVYTSE